MGSTRTEGQRFVAIVDHGVVTPTADFPPHEPCNAFALKSRPELSTTNSGHATAYIYCDDYDILTAAHAWVTANLDHSHLSKWNFCACNCFAISCTLNAPRVLCKIPTKWMKSTHNAIKKCVTNWWDQTSVFQHSYPTLWPLGHNHMHASLMLKSLFETSRTCITCITCQFLTLFTRDS